jgi:hypothetical protein
MLLLSMYAVLGLSLDFSDVQTAQTLCISKSAVLEMINIRFPENRKRRRVSTVETLRYPLHLIRQW